MATPVLDQWGERLRERTAPIQPADDDAAHGYTHAHLCQALALVFRQVGECFDPEDPYPPGAPLLNVDLCPDWALPWLGQFVGVQLPAGTTPDQAREIIRAVSGWKRGSRGALEAAASVALTGTKTVYFRERDEGNAYRLQVRTITSETPDPAQVQALLMSQKPGGITLAYSTTDTWDWQQVTTEVATWTALQTQYATWSDVVQKDPI